MPRFQNLRTGDVVVVSGVNADAKAADPRWVQIADAGAPKLADYTVDQLKAYADEQGVDLSGASKKAAIIAALGG